MKKLIFIAGFALFLFTACEEVTISMPKVDIKGGEEVVEEPVYENMAMNQPCLETANCEEGLTCIGASAENTGTCQEVCEADVDCGNGKLCVSSKCVRTCSGLGEKCDVENNRLCCFQDDDGDDQTDVVCAEDPEGVVRCIVGEAPEVVEEVEEVEEEESKETEESEDTEEEAEGDEGGEGEEEAGGEEDAGEESEEGEPEPEPDTEPEAAE